MGVDLVGFAVVTWLNRIPRFRAARGDLQTWADREQWSRSRIREYQLAKLNDVWRLARTRVPHYASLARSRDLPLRFDSLESFADQFPILDKADVRTRPDRFLSAAAARGMWQRTGGSTGDPLRVYWSVDAHREQLRAKYRMEQSFGVDFLDRKAFFWGHQGSFAVGIRGHRQRLAQRTQDWLRRRLRVSAYRLGDEELDRHLDRLEQFQPRSLYGYSSAMDVLARRAAATGRRISSLRLCILTAEPATDSFLQNVSGAMGCPATVEYGSVECGLMAVGSPDGTLRVREDLVFLETIPQPCGRYAVIVTVLNNPSFPLLRYRIEDMTCGPVVASDQGFSTLPCVSGRDNDILIAATGKSIHSMAVKHVFEADERIRRFQVIQHAEGHVDVTLESSATAEQLRVDRLIDRMRDLVDGFDVSMKVVSVIAGNLAGKHRWIVSHRFKRAKT